MRSAVLGSTTIGSMSTTTWSVTFSVSTFRAVTAGWAVRSRRSVRSGLAMGSWSVTRSWWSMRSWSLSGSVVGPVTRTWVWSSLANLTGVSLVRAF